MRHEEPISSEQELESIVDASSTLESFVKTVEKRGFSETYDKAEEKFQEEDRFLRDVYQRRKNWRN